MPVAQLVEPKGLEHSDISPVQSAGPVTGAELSGDSLAPHVGSQPRQGSGVELSGDSLAPHVGSQPRQGSGVELSGDSLASQGSQPCSGSGVEELMEQVYRTNIQVGENANRATVSPVERDIFPTFVNAFLYFR